MKRRTFLKQLAQVTAAGAVVSAPQMPFIWTSKTKAAAPAEDAKFLIVLCAAGGASVIDSFMAIRESESASAATLNTFPDALVQSIDNTPFRALDLEGTAIGAIPASYHSNQSDFVKAHSADMLVVTATGTSVNHATAQRRMVNGNAAWKGRTLQEAVAAQYGAGALLPNVHLVTGTGFTERGGDPSLDELFYGELVANPGLWPLSLDGSRGLLNAPSSSLLTQARQLRSTLDEASFFNRIFASNTKIQRWKQLRDQQQPQFEAADLISKLMLSTNANAALLAQHGLSASPLSTKLQESFPNLANDPLERQAALAFLLLQQKLAVTVTLGSNFSAVVGEGFEISGGSESLLPEGSIMAPPLGFDYSHQAHRATQALMWSRVLDTADRLIRLLKSEEYQNGQSFWDRSLLYVATDFGRTKNRPTNSEGFGSGHDLNNGVLLLSPLLKGNTLLGGIDPDTGFTHGFDLETGDPDTSRYTTEKELYAGIAHALSVDTSGSGLPDMAVMRAA